MLTRNMMWQLGSEDGLSEYGDSEEPGVSIWQELQDETVRLESRKSSSSSQVTLQWLNVMKEWLMRAYFTDCNNLKASTDSLDSAEDFKPVEINLGEIRDMLSMYINKRKVSNTLLTGTKQWEGGAGLCNTLISLFICNFTSSFFYNIVLTNICVLFNHALNNCARTEQWIISLFLSYI